MSDSTSPIPSLEVILGPAGSGKTAQCLGLCDAYPGRALLLVPTEDDARRLRTGRSDAAPILPFDRFIRQAAGSAAPMSSAMVRLALAEIVQAQIPDDGYFAAVR